jgi:hypothetical protein
VRSRPFCIATTQTNAVAMMNAGLNTRFSAGTARQEHALTQTRSNATRNQLRLSPCRCGKATASPAVSTSRPAAAWSGVGLGTVETLTGLSVITELKERKQRRLDRECTDTMRHERNRFLRRLFGRGRRGFGLHARGWRRPHLRHRLRSGATLLRRCRCPALLLPAVTILAL